MASNDPYNYYNSTQPQRNQGFTSYNTYQSQPATTSATTQYQPTASTTSTTYQPDPYQYQRTPQYGAQANYNTAQDYSGSWSYGSGNTTSDISDGHAAEVLRRLGAQDNRSASSGYGTSSGYGNTGYASNTTSYGTSVQPATTATASSSQYATAVAAQQQARPSSVNALSTQSARRSPVVGSRTTGSNTAQYQQSQNIQRTASPLQTQTNAASIQRPATVAATNAQKTDTTPRYAHHGYSSTQTSNAERATNLPALNSTLSTRSSALPATGASQYQTSVEASAPLTVDPTQVYDAWPELQRKREIAAREAAVREAARKKAEATEAARKAEEDTRRAEEERRAQEEREAEEAAAAQAASKSKKNGGKKKGEDKGKGKESTNAKGKEPAKRSKKKGATAEVPEGAQQEDGVASEMRKMFEKMRELNSKNPELLQKMWDEERRLHLEQATEPTPPPAAPTPQPKKALASKAHANTAKATATPSAPPKPTSPRAARAAAREQGTASSSKATVSTPSAAPATVTTGLPALPAAVGAGAGSASSARGTLWPPEKKALLASVAASWLNAVQENVNRQVAAETISALLDKNPSYQELCEMLEAQGLKLDRNAFAKALLAAVPDVAKPSSGATSGPATAGTSAESPTRLKGPGRSRKESTNAATIANGQSRALQDALRDAQGSPYPVPQDGAHASPYFTSLPKDGSAKPSTPGSQSTSKAPVANMSAKPEREKKSKKEKEPPKPQTKEEAARKRNFSDLVDLSLLSDEDEPPLPPLKRHESDLMAPTAVMVDPVLIGPSLPPGPANVGAYQTPYTSTNVPNPTLYPPSTGPSTNPDPNLIYRDDPWRGLELVKPIDRKKAQRKSKYDPRTIARDVLVAAGRHPEMRPLNAHLTNLRMFHQVPVDADLDTLRWDLIDPGEPIYPEGFDNQGESSESEVEEVKKATPAVRPRPSQAPSTAPTNHMAPSTARPDSLGAAKRPETPDYLSEFQQGPIGKGSKVGRPRLSAPGALPANPTGDFASYVNRFTAHAPPSSTQPNSMNNTPQAPATNLNPGKTTGYQAFRQNLVGPDGTPLPVKRGRPVGWRKSIHGSEAIKAAGGATPKTSIPVRSNNNTPTQPSGLRNTSVAPGSAGPGVAVIVDSRSPSVASGAVGTPSSQPVKRGRGRPRKHPFPQPQPELHYAIYKCGWKDCAAELHNLDTIKKHVQKLHAKMTPRGSYLCFWAGCAREEVEEDEVTGEILTIKRQYNFKTREEWWSHVESQHINEMAWRLGDGPVGGTSDTLDMSDSYLSDARGRLVTPIITTPQLPKQEEETQMKKEVSVAEPPRRGRPPAGEKQSKAEEAAWQSLKQMQQKKLDIGPGMDRGGATLVTKKRRAGFIDDEDFEEFIDDA